MTPDERPREGQSEPRGVTCWSCFLRCKMSANDSKPYPCDRSLREWAAAHRLDPGDELGYVWEVEQ